MCANKIYLHSFYSVSHEFCKYYRDGLKDEIGSHWIKRNKQNRRPCYHVKLIAKKLTLNVLNYLNSLLFLNKIWKTRKFLLTSCVCMLYVFHLR